MTRHPIDTATGIPVGEPQYCWISEQKARRGVLSGGQWLSPVAVSARRQGGNLLDFTPFSREAEGHAYCSTRNIQEQGCFPNLSPSPHSPLRVSQPRPAGPSSRSGRITSRPGSRQHPRGPSSRRNPPARQYGKRKPSSPRPPSCPLSSHGLPRRWPHPIGRIQPADPQSLTRGSRTPKRTEQPAVSARPAPAATAQPDTTVASSAPRTDTAAATRTEAVTTHGSG